MLYMKRVNNNEICSIQTLLTLIYSKTMFDLRYLLFFSIVVPVCSMIERVRVNI